MRSLRVSGRLANRRTRRIRPDLRLAKRTAHFSSASSDFKVLGAFFCNKPGEPDVCPGTAMAESLRCGSSAEVAHGRPRGRIPDLVGSRPPRPYHFPARIQSFQGVAAPFPGGLRFAVTPSRAAIPATETRRFKRSTIGSAVSSERAGGAPVSPASSVGNRGRHNGREAKLRVAIFCLSVPF